MSTVYVVTDAAGTAGSASDVTLAYALTQAVQNNQTVTITFAPSLAGQSITLTMSNGMSGSEFNSSISIGGTANVTIDGSAAPGLTIVPSTLRPFFVDQSATLTLEHLAISGANLSLYDGGAVIDYGTLITDDCTFNNDVVGAPGGAIAVYPQASATITDCTFSDDSASAGGAVFATTTAVLNVIGSTFDSDSSGLGGAIYSFGGTVSLTNSTFVDDSAGGSQSAGDGGGVASFPAIAELSLVGSLNVSDCTFSGDSAVHGGAIAGYGTLTLNNSILANSPSGGDFDDTDSNGSTISGGNDLIDDGSFLNLFTNSLSGNAGLDANGLQNNGGPTQTVALQPTSQAIDAGNNAAIPSGVTTDQRGFPRIFDTNVDIGAFEVVTPPTANAGGPYVITADHSLTLDASASADAGGLPLTYSWDINGDGTFGDATGVNPTLTWSQLTALGITSTFTTANVRVEVTDGYNPAVTSAPVALSVIPVHPFITSSDTTQFTTGAASRFTVTTAAFPTAAIHETGALPAGISFVDNSDGTATLAGNPAAQSAGTYPLTFTAANGISPDATQDFTLTINSGPSIILGSSAQKGIVQSISPDGVSQAIITDPFPHMHVALRVAIADGTDGAAPDTIVAAGPGGPPLVAVYDDATGKKIAQFLAFPKSFSGGLYVATANVNNDAVPDIIVAQGGGGTSLVRIFSGTNYALLASFHAFNAGSGIGVRVAAGVNADGSANLVAASGPGTIPATVKVFDLQNIINEKAKALASFTPFGKHYAGGVFIASGDFTTDAAPDIAVSQGTGHHPSLAIFQGSTDALINRLQLPSANGLAITAAEWTQAGVPDIVALSTLHGSSVLTILSAANNAVLVTLHTQIKGSVSVA
jgi:hypothetical protein